MMIKVYEEMPYAKHKDVDALQKFLKMAINKFAREEVFGIYGEVMSVETVVVALALELIEAVNVVDKHRPDFPKEFSRPAKDIIIELLERELKGYETR